MTMENGHNPPQSDEAAAPPLPEEEFDAGFAEFTGAAPAATEANPEPATPAVESPAPAIAAADSPGADGNASPQGQTTTDDIWANAPAEYREAYQATIRDLDLRLRSANNRAVAFQRQLEQARAAQPTEPPVKQDAQPSDTGDVLERPEIAKLREDFPELAGPLLDIIAAQQNQLAQLGQTAGQFQQQQIQAERSVQESILAGQHPDWLQAAADDRFRGWLDTQPRLIQEAFARNEHAIVDGPEAAFIIGQFKQAVGFGQQPSSTRPAPADDRRQRQIANGRDTGRNSPATVNAIPDDFDAAFEALASTGAFK